ncbi:hypothetical protein IV102_31105 [bacterium]|nr:hypothetical protein [bacterium]
MPANACFDPLEAPCSGGRLIYVDEGPLPDPLPPGTLVSWPQHRPLPDLPQEVALEIRSRGGEVFFPGAQGWSLYLDCLDPFDLGQVEQVLEAARAAGCIWVVAASVNGGEGGAQDYRYRLYSLIRLLCDRFKLKFSIYDRHDRPPHQRLNHYLASQRGCCRFPVFTLL